MSHLRGLLRKNRVLIYVCAAAYLASGLLWLVVPVVYRSDSEWSPYEVVLTPLESAEAESRLLAAGLQEVITRQNTEVYVTRFNRVESLPLEVALQLDELDPRRDPFISNLESYFDTGDGGVSLLLVRLHGSRWSLLRTLRRALGPGTRVGGFSVLMKIVAAGILACTIAISVLLSRRTSVFTVLAGVAWLPAVVAFGFPVAVASSLVLLSWSACAGDFVALAVDRIAGQRPLPRRFLSAAWPVYLVIISFFAVWTLLGLAAAFSTLIAASGLLSVTVVLVSFGATARVNTDHDLFLPVSIFTGAAAVSPGLISVRRRPVAVLIVSIAFFALPPMVDNAVFRDGARIPTPMQPATTELSYESISVLSSIPHPAKLVDISDYLTHRAYQQTFLYGREYRMPEAGETVTLSRFRESESGSYSRFSEDVVVFDEVWLEESLASPPFGISTVLVSLGKASGVVAVRERGLYSGYPQILRHLVFVILALVPVVPFGRRVPRVYRRQSKVVEIARRRKQVA